MLRHLLSAGICAAALVAALPAAAQDAAAAPASAAPPAAAPGTRPVVPTMSFGTWGVDTTALDPAIDPGDDFFDYVNAKWIAANPIPPEFSRFGAFDMLRETSTERVEKVVTDLLKENPAPGTNERRLVDAYQSYLDTAAIDARGLAPVQPLLQRIYAAPDLGGLIEMAQEPGFVPLVTPGVTVDDKDPNAYIVGVGFNGMGLPDRDYYLVENEQNTAIREAYRGYLAFLLGKAGYTDPQAAAKVVYDFEAAVAGLEWDRAVMRNDNLTYNKLTRAELTALAPGFPVQRMLDAAKVGSTANVLVRQLPPTTEEIHEFNFTAADLNKIGGGLPGMMALLQKTPLETIKAFMASQTLSAHAEVLPSDLDQARFALYGKLLNGQEEQRPRWKRAMDTVEDSLGEQLGAVYVERYFPPEAKAQMEELVANLRKALGQSIEQNSWMTEPTRKQALAKLGTFNPKIGYPDSFKAYEGLAIAPGDAFGNSIRSQAWQLADMRARLGTPVDKTEWFMFPQTVNAYYNPVFNEVVFPAAILQPPFFNPTADPAVNYGGIGAVIGHEMGHGFDDQGSRYDATGTLANWWEDADRKHFDGLGDKIVQQYNGYCPYDDGKTCVNGRLTLGENIGDIGGLSMAYRAYHMALGGKEAPVIDGLTGDQRFFLSWAQVWRSMVRDESGRQRLITDPHSPGRYRANGAVRNMDAWYKAFNVTADDALYLPPSERVHIW